MIAMRYAPATVKDTLCAGVVEMVRPTDQTMEREKHTVAAVETGALGEPMLATGTQCATARVKAMPGGKVTGMETLTARVRGPATLGVMVKVTAMPCVKVREMGWLLGTGTATALPNGQAMATDTPFVRALAVALRFAPDAGPETQDARDLALATHSALGLAKEIRGARGRAMAVLGVPEKVQGTRSEMVAAQVTLAG